MRIVIIRTCRKDYRYYLLTPGSKFRDPNSGKFFYRMQLSFLVGRHLWSKDKGLHFWKNSPSDHVIPRQSTYNLCSSCTRCHLLMRGILILDWLTTYLKWNWKFYVLNFCVYFYRLVKFFWQKKIWFYIN